MSNPSTLRSHRQLLVWQRGIELARECYRVAKLFPRDERFELGSQLRSASASVTANIAEGKGRRSAADYARCLAIARGSVREVDSHLELATALEFVRRNDVAEAQRLADEVIRMLSAMMRKLAPL